MPPTKAVAKTVKRAVTKAAAPPSKPPDEPVTANGHPDDEDDEPTQPSRPKMSTGPATRIRRGFTEGQKQMDSTSSFAQTFKPDEKSQVIKFLEKDPYASFRRHWIETRNDQNQTTNRPYTCPLSFDDPCPLCEVGDRPQATSSFNVAVIGDDGQVILRSWDVGARLFNVLKGYANDPKIGPLTKGYFIVSKTGKKSNVQYNVSPVRAASLQEDYDTPVPDQAALDALTVYTADIIEVQPTKKLRELAQELTAEED